MYKNCKRSFGSSPFCQIPLAGHPHKQGQHLPPSSKCVVGVRSVCIALFIVKSFCNIRLAIGCFIMTLQVETKKIFRIPEACYSCLVDTGWCGFCLLIFLFRFSVISRFISSQNTPLLVTGLEKLASKHRQQGKRVINPSYCFITGGVTSHRCLGWLAMSTSVVTVRNQDLSDLIWRRLLSELQDLFDLMDFSLTVILII